MKFNKKNIYITLFGILYGGVALVSLIHAVSFFALANLLWLAILLAVIFEIGQSAVLFSILTSSTGKSKVMPWTLMCILTAVQILGNVFSSYKYIVSNSPENLRFFKEPVFIWTDIPDAQATVIITYIVGGILPLVALAMSAMVTNYLEDENSKQLNQLIEDNTPQIVGFMDEIPKNQDIEKEKVIEIPEDKLDNDEQPFEKEKQKELNEEIIEHDENIIKEDKLDNGEQEPLEITDEQIKETVTEDPHSNDEEPIKEEDTKSNELVAEDMNDKSGYIIGDPGDPGITDENLKVADALMGGNILNQPKKESHFINNKK